MPPASPPASSSSASSPETILRDKRALVDALRDHLDKEIAVLTKAQADAMAAATHEEAKPENDKDTRALEASYLARGQAERVRTLEDERNALGFLPLRAYKDDDEAALGALIEAEIDGEPARFFLAPCSGGFKIGDVQIITPASPLGRALVGRRAGDASELPAITRGKAPRDIEIVAVR